ncbi:hypothetical protein [Pseudobutyrivibrio sp.]|uniref:hypothetical protein n=1 Tax=Pseudobutyrivibrio sp. TaxID=2014367 RepID=UPI0025DD8DD2|nr:hypothetical protein [Pseudobutyrivibrio sp.]
MDSSSGISKMYKRFIYHNLAGSGRKPKRIRAYAWIGFSQWLSFYMFAYPT